MPLPFPEGVEAIGHSHCPRLTSCVMLHPVAGKLATEDFKCFDLFCSLRLQCSHRSWDLVFFMSLFFPRCSRFQYFRLIQHNPPSLPIGCLVLGLASYYGLNSSEISRVLRKVTYFPLKDSLVNLSPEVIKAALN